MTTTTHATATTDTPTTYTRVISIGTHRDKPRLWLEGAWLAAAGFERGLHYTATFKADGSIRLQLDAEGSRKISGKTKGAVQISVIDINSSDIGFTGVAVVTVRHGVLMIKAA